MRWLRLRRFSIQVEDKNNLRTFFWRNDDALKRYSNRPKVLNKKNGHPFRKPKTTLHYYLYLIQIPLLMKKLCIALAFCGAMALTACGGKKGSNTGGGSENGSGGNAATPAKSNLDTTTDSAKMPAHVDTAKK